MRRRVLLVVVLLALVAGLLVTVRLVGPGGGRADAPTADAVPCRTGDVDRLDLSDPAQGRLAWHDEFSGTRVDPDRWTVRDDTTLSFDQARIRADAVEVRGGRLRITARSDPAGDTSGERPVSTGYLDTIGHFAQQHGRWEVRARLPVEPGRSRALWPAFWLRASDLPGEIDVVEAWGTPTSRQRSAMSEQYAWTVHEDTTAPPGYRRVGGWGRAAEPLADGFHTYAVDWTPGCLRFSLDGRTTGFVDLDREPRLRRALDGPVDIRLNLQVGSSYWGRLDPERPGTTGLPATFEIDHVRVFRPRPARD